jgi:hypothetical protein
MRHPSRIPAMMEGSLMLGSREGQAYRHPLPNAHFLRGEGG